MSDNTKRLTVKELREILNNVPTEHDDKPVMAFHNEFDDNGEETCGTGVYMTYASLQDAQSEDDPKVDVVEFWIEN